VQSPVARGSFAARFEVRNGDVAAGGNRAELFARGLADGWPDPQGSERYYGWATFIPADYRTDPRWQILLQWKGEYTGSPPLAIGLEGDQLNVSVRNADGRTVTRVWHSQMRGGQWDRFVMHVRWSPNPSNGFIEFWRNGELVLPRMPARTMMTTSDGVADRNYLKLGLYRSRGIAVTQVLYHDAMRIGRTYRSVTE
jgi:hypothetical protein